MTQEEIHLQMTAPKEIYIHTDFCEHIGEDAFIHLWTQHKVENKDNIKYIRADLVELTWEDIKKIELLLVAVECSSARPYRGKDLYQEVLRRFLESKKKIEL